MASIATCPQCASQLSVPESSTASDHAECPLCEATFLLANVVQLTVPPARIINLSETQELSEPTPGDVQAEVTDDSTDVRSLPSWEKRLKRAIEADSTEMNADGKSEAEPAADSSSEPQQIEHPEFEFQIDPPSESVATASEPAALTTELRSTIASGELFEADLGSPEDTAEMAEAIAPANHEAPEVALQIKSRRQPQRRSWAKMAAVIAGPGVMGTLLGLYALLWMRGPSADFVGLANVLPEAMLPAPATLEDDAIRTPAEPSTVVAETELAETQLTGGVEENAAPPMPPPVHHDEAVQTAAAEQPVSTPPAIVGLSAEQFSGLVLEGRNALPGLVEGNLRTNESMARKGQAYMALCRLAEHFDFVRQPGLAPATQTEVDGAKALFGHVFASAAAQGDLSTIASRWWGHASRPNQGIFLAGQVEKTQPVGNRTLCLVVLGGPTASDGIPVLVERPSVAVGSRIGVVGRIVSSSDKELADLGIDLSQVVVSQQSYDLP